VKISKSEALFERAKKVSPGGVHSPVRGFRGVGGTPRFIDRADGAEMFDVDGNGYVDFCMAWGPLLFGHRDPEIRGAVEGALAKGWSFGTTEAYSLELAEFMTKEIPWLEKVRFVNSGTEAVMAALRVARAATGRNKILKFDGCYHGHVDSMLVRAGSGLAEMASPDSAGVSESVASDTVVVPLNDIEAVKLAFKQHKDQIAAVIIEPVPANNGLLLQTNEFLKEVAKLAQAEKTLVLFDEVITGFRTAFGGMAEITGIRPDLVTYGKVIGGGFPVGAYGGRKDLMEWVAPLGAVYQAGTLSANPVAMTAGLAMLKKLKRDNPYAKLAQRTEKLASELEAIAKSFDYPGRVQRFSSMFWPIYGTITTKDGFVRAQSEIPVTQKERYAAIFHSLLNQGFYSAPSGYEVSFLSTAHTDDQLTRYLEAFKKSLGELAKK
jgi:glutamate-1-semialdehyde 2,1-aminomutase